MPDGLAVRVDRVVFVLRIGIGHAAGERLRGVAFLDSHHHQLARRGVAQDQRRRRKRRQALEEIKQFEDRRIAEEAGRRRFDPARCFQIEFPQLL